MNNSSVIEVQHISTTIIQSSSLLANSDNLLELTPLDNVIPRTDMAFLYIYSPPNHEKQYNLQVIQNSLEQTLLDYPELTGEIQTDLNTGKMYLKYCNKGVKFVIQSCNAPLNSFSSKSSDSTILLADPSLFCTEFCPLPSDSNYLTKIYLTQFIDYSLMISIQLNHNLMDGSASFHFMNYWASKSRETNNNIEKPFNDRSILYAKGKQTDLIPNEYKLISNKEEIKKAINIPACSVKVFHFSAEEICALKKEAINTGKEYVNSSCTSPEFISSFDALTAHLWICVSRARGIFDKKEVNNTKLKLAIDSRGRLSQLSDYYSGNGALIASTQIDLNQSSEVETKEIPIDHELNYRKFSNLGFVARKIRSTINSFTSTRIENTIEWINNQSNVSSIHSEFFSFEKNHFSITSWKKFNAFEANFQNFNKPFYVGLVNFKRIDGVAMILPSNPIMEEGSIDIGIGLQTEHMNKLINDAEFRKFQKKLEN